MTASYVLLAEAEADLRGIIRYTRKQWGDARTRRYVARLTRGIEAVVEGNGFYRSMDVLYPGLRILHCEHHYIFCLIRADEPALVVALFHERMDLMARVADRLR